MRSSSVSSLSTSSGSCQSNVASMSGGVFFACLAAARVIIESFAAGPFIDRRIDYSGFRTVLLSRTLANAPPPYFFAAPGTPSSKISPRDSEGKRSAERRTNCRRQTSLRCMLDCSSGAPLAKGARLSALHRGIFRSFGPALFVGRLVIFRLLRAQWRFKNRRRLKPAFRQRAPRARSWCRGAGFPGRPSAQGDEPKARRAAPCSIRRTSPVDAPREQGGGRNLISRKKVK